MSWQDRAACEGHPDPDLWFADRGGSGHYVAARAICDRCPVRVECLGAALEEERHETQRFGMRGGYTGAERDYLSDTGKVRIRKMGRASLVKIHRHRQAIGDYNAATDRSEVGA